MATLPSCNQAAVTMTAELCDCYPTKAVGVSAVLDAVAAALPGRSVVVWGVDGEFHASPRSAGSPSSPRRPTGWHWRRWPRD